MDYYQAKSAILERDARIGRGTRIWHFSHIMKGATIGENCNIGQNVFVGEGVIIGSKVKIQNNVSIYSGVEIEDNVFCGPSVVFTNVKKPRSAWPVNKRYEKTLVKEGATIGANATIMCGITIGRYAFIGAGSVVTKDVPDFGVVYGNPARLRGWTCRCANVVKNVAKTKKYKCGRCNRKYAVLKGKVVED